VDVLSPPAGEPSSKRSNNRSLVLALRYGRHSFLLTGDIERSVERSLVREGLLPPSDVLKVAHHGSRTSTTPEFLAAVRPSLALISAGHDNTFRHPHADVVESLERAGALTLRTDQVGLSTVWSDGRRLSAEAFNWPARPRRWWEAPRN
jgi:competence protein ComEC